MCLFPLFSFDFRKREFIIEGDVSGKAFPGVKARRRESDHPATAWQGIGAFAVFGDCCSLEMEVIL
jgi:hypothetical protein